MPVSATVQAPALAGLLDNTTQSIPTQRIDASGPFPPKARVELWHARVAQLIAADYTGRAKAHRTTGRPDLAARDDASAETFGSIAQRLSNAYRGARQLVRSPDVDAVRWYLVTLIGRRAPKQRAMVVQLQQLLALGVAGQVENLTGVHHA